MGGEHSSKELFGTITLNLKDVARVTGMVQRILFGNPSPRDLLNVYKDSKEGSREVGGGGGGGGTKIDIWRNLAWNASPSPEPASFSYTSAESDIQYFTKPPPPHKKRRKMHLVHMYSFVRSV